MFRFTVRHARRAGVLGLFVSLAACGGSSVTPTRASAALSAASATGCITPSTSAQTAALPAAGGLSGTLSIGAFATASTTCVGVTVATGADATLSAGVIAAASASGRSGAKATRRALAATSPTALAQIELSNATDEQLSLTSVSLQLPGSVPAGTYPATITTINDRGDGVDETTVANYTITIDATGKAEITAPSGSSALAIVKADTNGVLSIYPAGTVLPTPTPTPTTAPTASPTPAISPTPTSTPTLAPTATPTAKPTATPTPAPTSTANPVGFTTSISLDPPGCVQFPASGGTQKYTVTASAAAPTGFTYVYGWIGVDGSSLTTPTEIVEGYPDGQDYDGSPGNTATLTEGPAYGSGAGVVVELFIMAKAGAPYYGEIYEVDDSSGKPDVISEPWDEGVTTCPAAKAR